MSRQLAAFLTVLSLIGLISAFPLLINYWILIIIKAIPSAFTLGMSTVLLYKAFRYPRGSAFTLLGLAQIFLFGWILWKIYLSGYIYIAIPILIACIFLAPQSARKTWKWIGVDRYYKNNINEK